MKLRPPASEGEREAANYMAGILERECGCKEVITETFTTHPAAFYGYFFFTAALCTLCTLFFFISQWMSIVFGCMCVFLFISQFVLYREIIDPLFPEKESVNVTAIRSCHGETRQRILLNGHTDAAWEFPLNYHFGGIVFEIPGVASLSGVIIYTILSVLALSGAGEWVRIVGLSGLVFIPFYILLACTYNIRRTVEGANDNLTGCFLGIALLREMEQKGIRLEHTEIGVLLTGSEEAGTKGAKHWSKMHKNDFNDVPTYILCLDTIHDPDQLMVNNRDLNSTVRSDPMLCETFMQAAKAAGVPCKNGRVPLFGGSTDSAAFTQGGFRSVGITGLSHILENYYHTRRDSWDNLNPEGLDNCFKAVDMFVRLMDEKITDK